MTTMHPSVMIPSWWLVLILLTGSGYRNSHDGIPLTEAFATSPTRPPSSLSGAQTPQFRTGAGDDIPHVDVIICGGGPTGLLTAIMLAQKFPQVRSDGQVRSRTSFLSSRSLSVVPFSSK
jgi:hypothetical protein